jgi:enoyl-CoA hydratase/carnithine racemase
MDVLLAADHGPVRVLTLNRPERRNALNTELLRALEDGFAAAEAAAEVEVIVLTGTGPSFCAGVDLGELEEKGRPPVMGAPLEGVTKPVIGAVNGPAITGGLELVLMCDLAVASERAAFGDTHARLGLLPGWGQIGRLTAAVGTRRATDLLLTSRVIDASEAVAIGIVEEIVPHTETLSRALELATTIAAAPGPAVRAILAQLREGMGEPLATTLRRERERAEAFQGEGFDTAFVKRKRESLK